MGKIVLHLGYPKTGTTYLQRQIFSQAVASHTVVTPTFDNCDLNIARFMHEIETAQLSDKTRLTVTGKPLILSLEGFLFEAMRFVVDNKFVPRSFPRALEGLQQLCSHTSPAEIDIVIYLRRQDELAHSLYAESYTYQLRFAPDLDTIEKYVDQITSEPSTATHPGWYYDFSRTLDEIRSVFPQSNLHVRFYEDLAHSPEQELAFWSGLTGVHFAYAGTRENVRSSASNSKIADQPNLRVLAVRLKTRFLPNLKLPRAFSKLAVAVLSRFKFGTPPNIELTPRLARKIREHFGPRNQALFQAESLQPTAWAEHYSDVDHPACS